MELPLHQPGTPAAALAAARRRRNWWAGAGAFAAAAVALFIVIPITDKANEAPEAKAKRAPTAQSERPARQLKRAKQRAAEGSTRSLREARPEPESARKEQGRLDSVQPKPESEKVERKRMKDRAYFGAEAADSEGAAPQAYPPGMGVRGSRAEAEIRRSRAAREQAPAIAAPAPAAPPPLASAMEGDVDVLEEAFGGEPAAGAIGGASEQSNAKLKKQKSEDRDQARAGSAEPQRAAAKGRISTQADYPETAAFNRAVRAAINDKDPARALAKIQRALQKYTRVEPSEKAAAYRQAARLLARLGRDAEAAEAKKKAREVESAN